MPLAVLCFMILLNRAAFMGPATPRGRMRVCWNAALGACLLVMAIAAWFGLETNWHTLQEHLGPR